MTIAGKQNLNELRKCSREWYLCTLFYILQSEEKREVGYMKSTGDRLGRWQKAERGWGVAWNLWDWIKGKMTDTHFFYTSEYRIVNSQQLT